MMATTMLVQVGRTTTVDGFGRLERSRASMQVSYDRTLLENVILHRVDLGQYHVADAIRSGKKESMRPGMLRVCVCCRS